MTGSKGTSDDSKTGLSIENLYSGRSLWQQEGNELLHEMNRQIFYERLNDQIPNENVKALKESFAYHYRNEAETKGRLKYSVSEIKRMSQAADTEEVMYSSVSMEKEKGYHHLSRKLKRFQRHPKVRSFTKFLNY